MSFPADYEQESLYDREAWFLHDVLEIDAAANRVVGLCDTTQLGALVSAQTSRGGHQRHVPGAVMIQITATLGQLHLLYVLGKRASDGWCGYGTHIDKARFASMGIIGPPMVCEATATRVRTVRKTLFVDYQFRYTQEGRAVYDAAHIAAYLHDPSKAR